LTATAACKFGIFLVREAGVRIQNGVMNDA
jgi:hypothetical protein